MTTRRRIFQWLAAATDSPTLPSGADERVAGFGVMGLPFSSGHYLAFRHFPASSFAPAYRSVWHRTPSGEWTFYATTPAEQSCSRYFSSATTVPAVQCEIAMTWMTPWSVAITIPGLLDWTVEMSETAATQRAPVAMGWSSRVTRGRRSRRGRRRPRSPPVPSA